MPKTWKRKAWMVVLATLIGIYVLVPTVFQLNKYWEASEANGAEVPWYVKVFPKKNLNLGLDLRGGIYIEMEVDLQNAVKRKADLFASDLESVLGEKKIAFESITQPSDDGKLHIRAKTETDIGEIKSILRTDYKDDLTIYETTTEKEMPTIVVGFSDMYLARFKDKVADQALETIRNRIDRYGVAEPSITKVGTSRVAIELPGIKDPDRAINIIKKTGQLEFKIVDESIKQSQLETEIEQVRNENKLPDNYSAETVEKINQLLSAKIPEDSEIAFEIQRDSTNKKVIKGVPYLLKKKAEVTGDMLQNAMVSVHDNEPYVDLSLDKRGTKLFGDLTTENVGKKLAIVLDGNVMKAPTIKEPIPSGRAQITLGFGDYQDTLKEAEDLVLVLQEGALPATLHEATKTVIGPTLGNDSIRQGLKGSLIAAIVVILFMIVYYRLSGVWADIAVIVNVLLLLGILALFQATLTLPGIAGIVLTVAMAVDANVIINERIKEELALGKTPKAAIDSGYKNAFNAVFDSNITTLIAGVILYQFGTGPIKGFAVTLSAGIITTLFTAIIITKLIFDYRVLKGSSQKISI